MDSNIGVWDKQASDNVSDHGKAYDGLCEPHDNEGWIVDCEATTWSRDVGN